MTRGILARVRQRWRSSGGYAETLQIALPLILSTSAWSVQHFIDRMFLAWYSPGAIAASMPSGLLNFSILSIFIGTAGYVNAFVAQYHGAGREERIGPAVWQGIYFSILAMVPVLLCIPVARPLFEFAGHTAEVRDLEIRYFTVLALGGFFPIATAAISGFFTGLGKVWTVLWVNCVATLINVILDYAMIFGHFGFPELGITGAALATVCSALSSFVLFAFLLLRRGNRERFSTWSGSRFDRGLFARLLKFGLPNGIQLCLDMLGFTVFILLVGRYGLIELGATNIAFNINSLAFLPMLGMGIAVTVMVARSLGNDDPDKAEYATWSAAHLGFCYMALISFCYVVFPDIFLAPFGAQGEQEIFARIHDYGVVLLRFIAAYSLFDCLNLVFASAIKGAGDTRFVMKTIVILSLLLLVIPTAFGVLVFDWHLFVAWGFATVYIIVLGLVFLHRFLQGYWKTMRVIEEYPVPLTSISLPENPAID